jgi:hypothetical protein
VLEEEEVLELEEEIKWRFLGAVCMDRLASKRIRMSIGYIRSLAE